MINLNNPFWPYEEGFSIPLDVKRELDAIDPNNHRFKGYTVRGKPRPSDYYKHYITIDLSQIGNRLNEA